MPEDRQESQRPSELILTASGHEDCRAVEFARWGRIELEHERRHLSKVMSAPAFLPKAEREAILHEITDIDYFLSYLDVRIDVTPPS